MKRTLILWAMLAAMTAAHAQQGLHINELFEGRIVPKEHMMETRVRGKMIARYQLTYFHSLRFLASGKQLERIKELFEEDLQANASKQGGQNFSQVRNVNVKGRGDETFMIRLEPRDGKNRYLCYKVNYLKVGKTNETTVIYMEGALPSLDKLKEILQETTAKP